MSRKFSFSLAKDTMRQRTGDGERKRKKTMPDTSHVDKVSGVQLAPSGSIKPSLATSPAERVRTSKGKGVVT